MPLKHRSFIKEPGVFFDDYRLPITPITGF